MIISALNTRKTVHDVESLPVYVEAHLSRVGGRSVSLGRASMNSRPRRSALLSAAHCSALLDVFVCVIYGFSL